MRSSLESDVITTTKWFIARDGRFFEFFFTKQPNTLCIKWTVSFFRVNRSQTHAFLSNPAAHPTFHRCHQQNFSLLKIYFEGVWRGVARAFCSIYPSSQETIETWLKALAKVRIMHIAHICQTLNVRRVCLRKSTPTESSYNSGKRENSFEVEMRWLHMRAIFRHDKRQSKQKKRTFRASECVRFEGFCGNSKNREGKCLSVA